MGGLGEIYSVFFLEFCNLAKPLKVFAEVHQSCKISVSLCLGGLWHSELIQKHLITAFVPFLPLERKHIKLCIIDVLGQKNITATTDLVDRVADELQYSPGRSGLFSTSGCKRIEEKVDFVVLDVDDY